MRQTDRFMVLLFLLGGVLMAVFLTACGMTDEEKLVRAEKILQSKYGTEFTGERYIQQKFMRDYYRVTA